MFVLFLRGRRASLVTRRSCHNSAQVMHGQFTPGSHLNRTSELQT